MCKGFSQQGSTGCTNKACQKRGLHKGCKAETRSFESYKLLKDAEAVFASLVMSRPTMEKLMNFHARYKYLLMAHNQEKLRELGRFLANSNDLDIFSTCEIYWQEVKLCLSQPATRANHINAMQHMLGYFRKELNLKNRYKILTAIERFERGEADLNEPLGLLYKFSKQLAKDYLKNQQYFRQLYWQESEKSSLFNYIEVI